MIKFLKRLIWPSRSFLEWKLEEERAENKRILEEYLQIQKFQLNELQKESEKQIRRIVQDELKKILLEQNNQTKKYIETQTDRIEKVKHENSENNKKLTSQILNIKNELQKIHAISDESIWAAVFNSAIENSDWLKNKTFYPGRWAVGYPFLYVLYRVLNEENPQNILELGLGQTTRMISQYADSNSISHQVVEHDPVWMDFFTKDFGLSSNTKIVKLDLKTEKYLEDDKVYVYDSFTKQFAGQKFDFISIDGPFGGMAQIYARIDVLKMLPGCLKEEFVILIDDCQRSGEKKTIEKMKEIFEQAKIPVEIGYYSGQKKVCIITSEKYKFLTSL